MQSKKYILTLRDENNNVFMLDDQPFMLVYNHEDTEGKFTDIKRSATDEDLVKFGATVLSYLSYRKLMPYVMIQLTKMTRTEQFTSDTLASLQDSTGDSNL